MPSTCPSCGTPVVGNGPFDGSPNRLACPAQLKRTAEHFGSRDALDIRSLGRQTADALVASGLVKDLPGTVQQIVQQSGRQTANRDRSAQNRDQEVFDREP